VRLELRLHRSLIVSQHAQATTAEGVAAPSPNLVQMPSDPLAAADVPSARVSRLLDAGLALLVAVAVGSVLVVAAAHVDDRYNVNHVSGTWMALADDVRAGTLYRPLFEDGAFGGTWYTPLYFLLQAGAAELSDEYIVSGKLLAYATALAVLGLLFFLLRRVGCSRLVSAALVSGLLVSQAGLFAVTAIRGDMLPLLLQLGAVGLVAHSVSRRSLVYAGVLCALAITAKITAVWAPAALVLWLVVRERRRLPAFAVSFAVSLVALLGAFELASRGRMSETLIAVGGSGNAEASSPLAGLPRLFDFVVNTTGPFWLLLPFVLIGFARALTTRELTLYQLCLLVALPLLALVLADPGSDFNHLVDLVALAVLVVGEEWRRSEQRGVDGASLRIAMALALILGSANAYRQPLQADTANAAKSLLGREAPAYPNDPLRRYVAEGDLVLSEDPAIPVLRDRRPILLDAVSVRRIGLNHPSWLADLAARLDRGEFDKVVLVHPIENDLWYRERNFGEPIQAAIQRDYRLVARVRNRPLDYWVYAPR
jgi:hypothetical protein